MEVILKFFANTTPGDNSLVSRTLGKVAISAKDKTGKSYPQPEADQFWRCRIIKETQANKRIGCFLVEPIMQVNHDDLLRLLPGMYTTTISSGKLIVKPTAEYKDKACIMPLDHRHVFGKDTYCVIVDIGEPKVVKRRKTNPYT